MNFPQIANAFPSTNLSLIDDSGPLFETDATFSPCYQELWRNLWGLSNTIPGACGDCFSNSGDSLSQLLPFLSSAYPTANFGLISSQADFVIRDFLGDGQDSCTSNQSISTATFEVGLNFTLDSILTPANNWGSFIPSGQAHVFITGSGFYEEQINGKTLAEWSGDLTEGTIANLKE